MLLLQNMVVNYVVVAKHVVAKRVVVTEQLFRLMCPFGNPWQPKIVHEIVRKIVYEIVRNIVHEIVRKIIPLGLIHGIIW